jgi:hypothetical protein
VAIGHARGNHTPITVTDKDDVVKFFGFNTSANIANMGFKGDSFSGLMLPLAKARMGRSKHVMPGCAQVLGNIAVAPCTIPGAMNEYIGSHRSL